MAEEVLSLLTLSPFKLFTSTCIMYMVDGYSQGGRSASSFWGCGLQDYSPKVLRGGCKV